MSDPINFDLDGLLARYLLHPERRDVFVEGNDDKGLLRKFLQESGAPDVAVFAISVVNVPAKALLDRNLAHPSRRNEVIALAFELEAKGITPAQAACVADSDFDYILPAGHKSSLLLLTDYTSLELYAFDEELIGNLLVVTSPDTTYSGKKLLDSLSGPLQLLFSIRAVNVSLNLGLQWIESFDRFLSMNGDTLEFDDREFLKRYLLDRVPANTAKGFMTELARIQSLLTSDIRCRIRGHDFIRAIAWYLRAVEKKRHLTETVVRDLVYVALRKASLATYPLFVSIASRFN